MIKVWGLIFILSVWIPSQAIIMSHLTSSDHAGTRVKVIEPPCYKHSTKSNGDHYLFNDAFIDSERRVIVITRIHPDTPITPERVMMNVTVTNSSFQFIKPTSVIRNANKYEDVVIVYAHRAVKKLDLLYASFSYDGVTTPTYKLEYNSQHHVYITMTTMMNRFEIIQLDAWLRYYSMVGVDSFLLYYNGPYASINPETCSINSSSLEFDRKLSCYVKSLNNSDTFKNKTINVAFISWDYAYYMNESRQHGVHRNYHNAQPQAITSGLYRAKGYSTWNLNFDLDEFVLPGDGFRNLIDQFKKRQNPRLGGLCFKNSFSGFANRNYSYSKGIVSDDHISLDNIKYDEIISGEELPCGVRSKLALVTENVEMTGLHRLTKPKNHKLLESANSKFFHFIGHKNRGWGELGDKRKRSSYILFDNSTQQFDFKPMSKSNAARAKSGKLIHEKLQANASIAIEYAHNTSQSNISASLTPMTLLPKTFHMQYNRNQLIDSNASTSNQQINASIQ